MVSSEDRKASEIGAAILRAGGNAVDAAIAVGYTLAVTHPVAGALGGGGFMLVRLHGGQSFVVDFREKAPRRATVAQNEKQLAAGAHGYLSAPVPGIVAGYELARERWGTVGRERLLEGAIALAKDGHRLSLRQSQMLHWAWKRIRKNKTVRAIFGRGRRRKQPLKLGETLRQPRLAETLQRIADKGRAGFYAGETAKRIASAHRNGGGLVEVADLAAYTAVVRRPLRFGYRGLTVLSAPPPSMGGVAVAGTLLALEVQDKQRQAAASGAALHAFIEASRRAYADRRQVGGDPDFPPAKRAQNLLLRILDPRYHKERRPLFDPTQRAPSQALKPVAQQEPERKESEETTHFSVIDKEGNAVACTITLSAAFGAWVVVPRTGVFLSNAMGAFSPTGVNVLAPAKRPASSMSPTLLIQGTEAVAAIGSPGGDTIPATVAQLARNLVEFRMPVDRAVEAGRVYHDRRSGRVRVEQKRGPSPAAVAELEKIGHRIRRSPVPIGDANIVVRDPRNGRLWGHADSRKGGAAVAAD